MMTPRQCVRAAMRFERPEWLPVLYLNRDVERSDVLFADVPEMPHPHPADYTEWGYRWSRLDQTMGQPHDRPLVDWDKLADYPVPDFSDPARYTALKAWSAQHPDRYLVGGLGISGFNRMTFLRGFEQTLEDMIEAPERLEKLLDIVFSAEEDMIRGMAPHVQCVNFGDDWGTQRALMISPRLFREIFLPRYKRQFDLAHSLGLDVYFHSCGQVWDILAPLRDAGVNCFNLNQPDIFGVERLGKAFGGTVSFCCPVDHQTTACGGTRQSIFDYVRRLRDALATPEGGYIGYIEDYASLGMDEAHYQWLTEAFEALRSGA